MRFFRIISSLVLIFTMSLSAIAQVPYKRNKVIKELKYNIKDEDYKKALENVQRAFNEHPQETLNDADYYYYKTLANHNLALIEAKKVYLQDKPDTVKYFGFLYEALKDGLKCDSLANLSIPKGKTENKFHKELTQILTLNNSKLPAAAKFFFQKKDYTKAFNYADLYVAMSDSVDAEVSTVATVAVLSAYAQNNYQNAVKNKDAALFDSNRHEQILEVVCTCYENLKDTVSLEPHLTDGVGKYPRNKYFYATLVNLYNTQNKYSKALEVVDNAIAADCCNRDLWFIKGTEQMHLSDRDSALLSFQKAVELKEDDAESYSNIGNINLHRAHVLYEKQKTLKGKELKATKAEMNKALTAAKQAFEAARKYAEDNRSLWLGGLQEVYYKLNMGKELMQLEKKYN